MPINTHTRILTEETRVVKLNISWTKEMYEDIQNFKEMIDMPNEVSTRSKGPNSRTPYVPSWCYPNNSPKECPCGHHEGYHGDGGKCLMQHECNCAGLPPECLTPLEDM